MKQLWPPDTVSLPLSLSPSPSLCVSEIYRRGTRQTASKRPGVSSPASQPFGYSDKQLARHGSLQPAAKYHKPLLPLSLSLSLSLDSYLKALGGKGAHKVASSSSDGEGGVAETQIGNRPGNPPCIQGWQPTGLPTILLGALPGQGPCQQPGALPIEQTAIQPDKQRADRPTDSLPASLPKADRASFDSPSLSLSLSLSRTLLSLSELVWSIRRGCKADATCAWSP